MSQNRFHRRQLLQLFGATCLVALSGCGTSANAADRAAPTTLQFFDTAFDGDNTRALLDDFQTRNPKVQVQRTEAPANRLQTDLVANLASGLTQDLAFVPAGGLARLANNSWLRDLSRLAGAPTMDRAELPWAREQTTVLSKRYGALAWVRLHGFFYNRKYLTDVRQTAPASFDELTVVADDVERRGLGNYAFYWPLKNGIGVLAPDYLANGKPMFDAQLNPVFATDPLYLDALNWRLQAIYNWNLVDPRGLYSQRDDDESYPHGWSAFSWNTYDRLEYWQTSGKYLQSGHLANALVPSRTRAHQAIGAGDLYAIPVTTQQTDLAWELLYYLSLGDDYRAPRLRWRKSGLLFGYAPLAADNGLLSQAADWAEVDVLRQQLEQVCAPPAVAVPWRDEWLSYAKIQSTFLVQRMVSPVDFVRQIVGRWKELHSGWKTNTP